MFTDQEMDRSGWLPRALDFLIAIATELPAGVAEPLCHTVGFRVSLAALGRIISDFGTKAGQERRVSLIAQTFEPLLAAQWLTLYLPGTQERQGWCVAGCGTTRYLLERVEQMHCPQYRQQDWPINSGQMEGANKSVIGHRMKRAGQHWCRLGAAGMAAVRARAVSVSDPLSFDALRKRAFPAPHF